MMAASTIELMAWIVPKAMTWIKLISRIVEGGVSMDNHYLPSHSELYVNTNLI
jgi:hypothetical protein